jgi:hypothetical protein
MKRPTAIQLVLIGLLFLCECVAASAQTAQGTVNATLINRSGIAIVFDSDPAGVSLGANGTSAVTLDMGDISAYGPLSAGVSRSGVNAASFTVSTPFDVDVEIGGITSPSYTLTAQLASTAPTGFTYRVDSVNLSTAVQTVATGGTYNTDVQHNLGIIVSSASPGSGGPAIGTPLTTTINFVATAN